MTGISGVDLSKAIPMPGMGMPGGAVPEQGKPSGPDGLSNVRGVIVIRASKPLAADLLAKIPGYEAATHQGAAYYRPSAAPMRASQPALYLAAPDVLLVANESEIQRIAEKGSKQTRRPEFDFIETSPQIVIAMLSKSQRGSEMHIPPQGDQQPQHPKRGHRSRSRELDGVRWLDKLAIPR